MIGVAAPGLLNVTSPSVLDSSARTIDQFRIRNMSTKCIVGRSVHLKPFSPAKRYRTLCAARPFGLISVLPAADAGKSFPHSLARNPDSMKCAATACATMTASCQTQTLPRRKTATKAPVIVKDNKVMTPRLDDGGFGFPPHFNGRGGGGRGGGGGNMAGGFVLFGLLLLMSFLKDFEESWIAKRPNKQYENEKEDYQF